MDCPSPDYSAEDMSIEPMKEDELIAYLNDAGQVLDFDIQQIMYRFAQAYGEIFCISKKCHFDSLPDEWSDDERVVDGARSKWCPPLLLDGLISFLDNDAFNLSHRRTFNQHKILHECIHEELQDSYEDIHDMILARKASSRKSPSGTPSPGPQQWFPFLSSIACVDTDVPFLRVHGLESPWTDLSQLRESLLSGPASKSRDKLVSIVSWLCAHPSLRAMDMDLHKVFKVVVFKSLFVYPPPASRMSHGAQLGARARKRMRGLPSLRLLLPTAAQRSPTPALSATASPSPSPRSPLSPPLYASLRPLLEAARPPSSPLPQPPRQHGYCLRESASRAQREAAAMGLFRPIRSHPDLLALHSRMDTVRLSPVSSDSETPALPAKKRGRPPRTSRPASAEAKAGAALGLGVGRVDSPPSRAGHKRKAASYPDETREGGEEAGGEAGREGVHRVSSLPPEDIDVDKDEQMFAALCEQLHPHSTAPQVSPQPPRPVAASSSCSPPPPAPAAASSAPLPPSAATTAGGMGEAAAGERMGGRSSSLPPAETSTGHSAGGHSAAAPAGLDWELIPTAAWELSDEAWSLAGDRSLVRPVPSALPPAAFSSDLWEWMDKHCCGGGETSLGLGLAAPSGISL